VTKAWKEHCPIVKEGKGVDEGSLATFTSPVDFRYTKCAKFEVNIAFLLQILQIPLTLKFISQQQSTS
jgi:hypothetical protein